MNKKHWSNTLFKYTYNCKGRMSISLIFATISVLGGLVPYYGAYNLINLIIGRSLTNSIAFKWCIICLVGYTVQVTAHAISTSLSHISAYTILENIRNDISTRLMNAPLGEVLSKRIGKLKNTIIDRVELMEIPIAHMIPE